MRVPNHSEGKDGNPRHGFAQLKPVVYLRRTTAAQGAAPKPRFPWHRRQQSLHQQERCIAGLREGARPGDPDRPVHAQIEGLQRDGAVEDGARRHHSTKAPAARPGGRDAGWAPGPGHQRRRGFESGMAARSGAQGASEGWVGRAAPPAPRRKGRQRPPTAAGGWRKAGRARPRCTSGRRLRTGALKGGAHERQRVRAGYETDGQKTMRGSVWRAFQGVGGGGEDSHCIAQWPAQPLEAARPQPNKYEKQVRQRKHGACRPGLLLAPSKSHVKSLSAQQNRCNDR